MRLFFDTSFLIAALIKSHLFHARARPLYERAVAGEFDSWSISLHTLAELYCNLNRMPLQPRISARDVKHIIDDDILAYAHVIALDLNDYKAVINKLSSSGHIGAVTYDALAAYAAQKDNVDRLYTFNTKDFLRVWPEGASIITEP